MRTSMAQVLDIKGLQPQKFDTFFQKRFLPQPSLPINSSTCEGFQTEP